MLRLASLALAIGTLVPASASAQSVADAVREAIGDHAPSPSPFTTSRESGRAVPETPPFGTTRRTGCAGAACVADARNTPTRASRDYVARIDTTLSLDGVDRGPRFYGSRGVRQCARIGAEGHRAPVEVSATFVAGPDGASQVRMVGGDDALRACLERLIARAFRTSGPELSALLRVSIEPPRREAPIRRQLRLFGARRVTVASRLARP